jgi:hypothetical protein
VPLELGSVLVKRHADPSSAPLVLPTPGRGWNPTGGWRSHIAGGAGVKGARRAWRATGGPERSEDRTALDTLSEPGDWGEPPGGPAQRLVAFAPPALFRRVPANVMRGAGAEGNRATGTWPTPTPALWPKARETGPLWGPALAGERAHCVRPPPASCSKPGRNPNGHPWRVLSSKRCPCLDCSDRSAYLVNRG